MHLYNDRILQLLTPRLGQEQIHFVGLGAHDFQFEFGNLRVQNMLRVDFQLQGEAYIWDDGPSPAPVWLLIGQTPTDAILISDTVLQLSMASGDSLLLYTDESPYESQIFQWPDSNGAPIFEVF